MNGLPASCLMLALLAGAALAQHAPHRPYAPVRVSIEDLGARDPTFAAFRDRMREIINARDRARWRATISPQFRFLKDLGGSFDPRKTPAENAEYAMGFSAVGADGKPDRHAGWKTLAALFEMPFGHSAVAQRALCAPARPRFDERAFERLLAQTETSAPGDWEAIGPNVNVYAAPRHTSPVIERTGLIFIRIDHWQGDDAIGAWRRVVTPAGKPGFIRENAIASIYAAQLCVAKNNRGEWRVISWVGGGD